MLEGPFSCFFGFVRERGFPLSFGLEGGCVFLQSEGENPMETVPEIMVSMNEDGSAMHFLCEGLEMSTLILLETPLIKLIWAFIPRSHAFWEVGQIQI